MQLNLADAMKYANQLKQQLPDQTMGAMTNLKALAEGR